MNFWSPTTNLPFTQYLLSTLHPLLSHSFVTSRCLLHPITNWAQSPYSSISLSPPLGLSSSPLYPGHVLGNSYHLFTFTFVSSHWPIQPISGLGCPDPTHHLSVCHLHFNFQAARCSNFSIWAGFFVFSFGYHVCAIFAKVTWINCMDTGCEHDELFFWL